MIGEKSVFDATYEQYLKQLKDRDLPAAAQHLGALYQAGALNVPVLGKLYRISPGGIVDEENTRAPFPVCVILSQYILRSGEEGPQEKSWTAYRDLKDSAPLTQFFAQDVEGAIARHFSGRLPELERACETLGGKASPTLTAQVDLSRVFAALPRVPLALLFTDADEEFAAISTVLFEKRAERYLDAESLALLGRHLGERLQNNASPSG